MCVLVLCFSASSLAKRRSTDIQKKSSTQHGAENLQGFDVVLSIGTTSVFPYIAGPVVGAAQRGATTVEINPSTTPVSEIVAFRLSGPAAEVLDALDGMLADEETSQSKL